MDYAQAYDPPSLGESNEVASGLWHVYGIAPDTKPSDPFYIGITSDFRARAKAHNSHASAAYIRSLDLEAAGIDCTMFEICRFSTEAEARAYEAALISVLPDLTNRAVPSSPLRAYRWRARA